MTSVAAWISFASERLAELWLRIGEHLMLTGVSTGMAILLGIPLGICAARFRWLRSPLTGIVGILQTIPSLAMLALFLTLLGTIGALPAMIALTLYALLPIVRNTLTGLEGVPPAVLEAGMGIGMTPRQRLLLVELPLAIPVILAGIRTAAVVSVGIATLSAFIGAGGLGQFINRGLALSNTDLILLGAVPSAILALMVDGSIAGFQWGFQPRRPRGSRFRVTMDRILRVVALFMPVVLFSMGFASYVSSGNFFTKLRTEEGMAEVGMIRIGSKNFTEQLILGEIMAQLIEAHTHLRVDRRFNLGGTMICHGALENGEIDIYPEYTGTALTAILHLPVISNPGRVLKTVGREYRERFSAEWLQPFGLNSTYAITVRRPFAKSRRLETISDLSAISRNLRAGFTAEFSERPDGYPGLQRTYHVDFGEVRDLDPSLMYQAIANKEVDVISAFATDGRIPAYDLQPLKDDRSFFPPYQAAPVIRIQTLETYPELRRVLNVTAGLLDDETMQKLNFEVDEKKRRPRDVVRQFLESRELRNRGGD